jgi:hypothetical protein
MMLRRVNSALFEAPSGARIQVVVEAQDNNGVNDARFQYAGQILPRESILGLPGCSFTVAAVSRRFQAGVVFDPNAPAKARYDLLEVENGVKLDLQKSVKSSDSSPLIAFALDPRRLAVAASRGAGAAPVGPTPAAAAAPARRRAAGKKKVAKKRSPRKRAAGVKRVAKKTTARKTTAKKRARKTTARKQVAKRKNSPRRRR